MKPRGSPKSSGISAQPRHGETPGGDNTKGTPPDTPVSPPWRSGVGVERHRPALGEDFPTRDRARCHPWGVLVSPHSAGGGTGGGIPAGTRGDTRGHPKLPGPAATPGNPRLMPGSPRENPSAEPHRDAPLDPGDTATTPMSPRVAETAVIPPPPTPPRHPQPKGGGPSSPSRPPWEGTRSRGHPPYLLGVRGACLGGPGGCRGGVLAPHPPFFGRHRAGVPRQSRCAGFSLRLPHALGSAERTKPLRLAAPAGPPPTPFPGPPAGGHGRARRPWHRHKALRERGVPPKLAHALVEPRAPAAGRGSPWLRRGPQDPPPSTGVGQGHPEGGEEGEGPRVSPRSPPRRRGHEGHAVPEPARSPRTSPLSPHPHARGTPPPPLPPPGVPSAAVTSPLALSLATAPCYGGASGVPVGGGDTHRGARGRRALPALGSAERHW
ncbi:basic salivary proline-rich protein 4-like [Cinclus cinclus]|uniref:basic salivary proline-rich protein 4-like n=1 Tax=Cinclus cinclus TaxID=127875 RepID=UPI002E10378D